MGVDALGSWESDEYAAAWASEDVLAPVLELPRRISAALVSDMGVEVAHVVDLGSGPGAYLSFMLEAFPDASGTWVDSSPAMLELAQTAMAPLAERVKYVISDLEELDPDAFEPADVVVSSRALHHLSPAALDAAYRAVAAILAPGGFVFNLDHVGSPDDHWHGAYRRLRGELFGRRRASLQAHRQDGPLPPADVHLRSMTAAGLLYPDVPWRVLSVALLAARKPG